MQKKTCKKAVLLLSGGIDSTTLLYELTANGYEVHCLIFDYGQSLVKEVNIACLNAEKCGQMPIVLNIDLSFLNSNCSLISGHAIPQSRTFDEINSKTPDSYVPFRNGIFFAYAVAYGESNGINEIYGGCNGLNSGLYWDDTIDFVNSFERASDVGTDPTFKPKIIAPYSEIEKFEIVKKGRELGLDYDLTWSCYENGIVHCQVCDSCKQREKALSHG